MKGGGDSSRCVVAPASAFAPLAPTHLHEDDAAPSDAAVHERVDGRERVERVAVDDDGDVLGRRRSLQRLRDDVDVLLQLLLERRRSVREAMLPAGHVFARRVAEARPRRLRQAGQEEQEVVGELRARGAEWGRVA